MTISRRLPPLVILAALGVLPVTSAEAATWYRDKDGDGVGVSTDTVEAAAQPIGYAPIDGDCNDNDATRFPGNDEACDGKDNDCDDLIDTADVLDLQPWYIDGDGDGAGRPEADPFRGCEGPPGRVANDDDCDDADETRAPSRPEQCNGVDDDCNGLVDDEPAYPFEYYADNDGDGWGSRTSGTVLACDPPDGFVDNAEDCDDSSALFHPFAFEACTPPLADTNCDGNVGDGDRDLDGFRACEDCNDNLSTTYPGAPDTWYDGEIEDCDRESDFDRDGDGYDTTAYGGRDCADNDASRHPGAIDIPGNGIDEDCNGTDATVTTVDTDTGSDTDTDTEGLEGGCGEEGCAQAPASVAWLSVLVLLGLRRRQR
ncbi:MAG: putative metal-binding motif-containing protein [Alphaproteobacteria bacterium]|nr:putative metal-binding motif-containing protein [Alphaproteobacteria bacterium]